MKNRAKSLEEQKVDMQKALDILEGEAKELLARIEKARKDVRDVHIEEDVRKFVKENDIEDGFRMIRIYV